MKGKKTAPGKAAEAVALASVIGVPDAARQMGMPQRTLYQLYDDPKYAELREAKKEVVAAGWWAGIQVGFQRVVDLFAQVEDISKAAVAVGILFDKHALLTGQATARTEHRDLDDEQAANPDLERARAAYLSVVRTGLRAVGDGAGEGTPPNGSAGVPAVRLPDGAVGRSESTPAGAEGAADGREPDRRHRGTLAS
jgi:hypothetical protein